MENSNNLLMNQLITKKRFNERGPQEMRPLSLEYDVFGYATASVYFCQGNTKVLASITLQPSVPHFLRGQGTGWLTAEYSMLPSATHQRCPRESSQQNRNTRSVEISRILGRCLRTCVDLQALGEQTIIIDCDVLQADGGTRVACITAASLALKEACLRWHKQGIVKTNIFKESIYAISVGVVNDELLLDLDYQEDSNALADFNFILTESENILEIQGTAEKQAVSWKTLEQLKNIAITGITQLKEFFLKKNPPCPSKHLVASLSVKKTQHKPKNGTTAPKPMPFSLGNRLNIK